MRAQCATSRAAIAKHRNMVGSTTGWVYWH